MMSLVVKLVMLSRYDASDKNCSQGITELRELKQKFIQRKLMFPEILYVAVFLMMLEAESVVKDKITLMVNENYLDITLEEVIQTYTSYARDLELSKETQIALSGKRSKTSKIRFKSEEFEKCKHDGKCFKCHKEGLDVRYIECTKHNKNLNTVSAKTVSISRNNRYNDYLNARSATTNMSEEDRYEESIWYKENPEFVIEFEKQMRRKVHYVIEPQYLWRSISELARTQHEDLLKTLQRGFKYIENESFENSFKGLFSEINLDSEKLGKNYEARNKKLCTIIQKIAEGIADFSTDSDSLGDAYEYLIG